MPVSKNDLLSAIQRKLPQARLFWSKEPKPPFYNTPCALTAVSLADESKRFTMEMPNGIGAEPLDDLVKDYVNFFLDELKEQP